MYRLWMTSFLFAVCVYAQNDCKPCPPVCFERGYADEKECCILSAFNEPANFEVGPCAWKFWVDTSFIYWLAYEEGLDLANSVVRQTSPVANFGTFIALNNSTTLFQDTAWKPGFKVGFGFDLHHDNWSAFADYTRFRSRTTVSSGAAPVVTGILNAGPSFWALKNWDSGQGGMTGVWASSLSSVWRLRMDVFDVAITRPYYQGSHLIINPFGGFRAAWIRQNLRISTTPFNSQLLPAFPGIAALSTAVFHNRSYSWAFGPRGGMQGKWHFGWGLHLEGDAATSIVFTQYTTIASSIDSTSNVLPNGASFYFSDYNTMRFMNDMNLGIGWGSYLDCRRYHLDLLLTYDVQIFWNQNMMRALVDNDVDGTDASAGNLYLQGWTLKAQFDF